MHKTQLTLSDVQLAAVMNAVQFVIVALRLHPDVQTDRDFFSALSQGFAASDSHSIETWSEVHNMLSLALEDVSDPRLTPIPHVPVANKAAQAMRDATPPSPRDPDLN